MNKENNITLTPQKRKQQQKMGLIVAGLVFIGVVLAVSFSDMGGGMKQQETKKTKEEYTITIADPTKNAKIEDRWLVDAQDKMDKQGSKIDETLEENQQLKAKIEELQSEQLSQDEKFADLESKIETLSNKITEGTSVNQVNNGNQNQNEIPLEQKPSITTITFDDTENNDNIPQKQTTFNTQEGYISQGSYVPAKIISAVDVQVGISSQSDPKPVLIRITGDAKSAIFRNKKLSVDIKGCLITAGAIGELSSEKVYIKLSKMTCAKNDNEVTEVPIQGYVSAKGSNGVRGQVIMKEGDLIAKSFLSGMVGSMGQAYSQSLAPPLTFGGGTTTQTAISAENAAKRGIGGGLGASGNQIASYLIKRAEQYQPVISIPSGIEVEVVFLEGFFLDGRSKEIKTISNNKQDEMED